MALLRRGSSKISEDNFNSRLQREKAKTGAVTASLAWNDPSDLDLHALVHLQSGGKAEINYRHKRNAGGYLDVDMHMHDHHIQEEPVENIFWKKAPAGVYSISVKLFKKRGEREGMVPFRALLKVNDEEPRSVEGVVGAGATECFRFTVDKDGSATMGKVNSPMPAPMRHPPAPAAMKAIKAIKTAVQIAKSKAKAKAKGKAKAKAKSKVAFGKKAKVAVYKGDKLKTKGGLTKGDLAKSKGGKIVSAKKQEQGQKNKWTAATAKARAIKGYSGFKPLKKGTSFYEKTREVLSQM